MTEKSVATPKEETGADDEAAFASGFSDADVKTAKELVETTKEAEPKVEEPKAEPVAEYGQLTVKEIADLKAAAAKTASYDQQLSRLFGTTGNLSKQLSKQLAGGEQPPQKKVEIPKEAFEEMSKDFPELANVTKQALERALAGFAPTAQEPDLAKIRAMWAEREVEALEDAYPDWRTIVGHVDISKEQPDPANPFRAWLATKDEKYQERINQTESAQVISRAIELFQRETKPAPKPIVKARDEARVDRIRQAVQPRGSNAIATSGAMTEEQAFAAGFNSR